jgi:hypothetical protein
MKTALRYLSALTAVCVLAGTACAQTDDFSDGNDTLNPMWTHNSGYVGSSGQTWTVGGGLYRLQAPNNGMSGYGYVGSFMDPIATDVQVSGFFVSFPGPGSGGAFGIGARLNGSNALGGLAGYGYAYEPFAAGGLGEMVLYRINPGVSLTDLGSQQVSLDPSKDYIFLLSINGPSLHGQVFEMPGLGLVADKTAVDATYASGVSGLFGYSQNPLPGTDFSVDNFGVSVVPEPSVWALTGLGALGLLARRRSRS